MKTPTRPPRQNPPSQSERKERLKAALKANIARRKTQVRARDDGSAPAPAPDDRKE